MHQEFMRVAIEEAKKGKGRVNPNPLVGAVIVKDDRILSTGYHELYGGPHAEVNAINACDDVNGSTIYVTLEPCSHYGKTPPCTELIIKSKIKRCVIAILDPNPLVSGRGVKQLEEAGIEVIVGILKKEAADLNKVFFKYITKKIPYVFIKTGITLDGKIATRNFSSQWITNSLAREKVERYRNFFSGIMVGANTVLHDDPSLHCKIVGNRSPYRLILDREFQIDQNFKIIKDNFDKKTVMIISEEKRMSEKIKIFEELFDIKFIFFSEKDDSNGLTEILQKIGLLGIDSILVEGGSSVISSFFAERLYDGGEFMIAPKILGDEKAIPFIKGFSPMSIDDGFNLKNIKINIYDNNVGFEFYEEEGCLPV